MLAHPRAQAPIGWMLFQQSFDDVREQLQQPQPARGREGAGLVLWAAMPAVDLLFGPAGPDDQIRRPPRRGNGDHERVAMREGGDAADGIVGSAAASP
jgi:hypothetical protein